MSTPVICFGQQPCGFFPRRFLHAKIVTARRLQQELGGEIIFFYHDSDHDPRETQTTVPFLRGGSLAKLNFNFVNKIQRKWSPLYKKSIPPEWPGNMARQLGAHVSKPLIEKFKQVAAANVADFCLQMYEKMGLLEGMRVVRSSDPAVRQAAVEAPDFFVDVPYQGEIVRARASEGALKLHEGGDCHLTLPMVEYTKAQISPARDARLRWMQSIVRCTHYVAGLGEQAYLNTAETPEITFVKRDDIDRSDEAWTEIS